MRLPVLRNDSSLQNHWDRFRDRTFVKYWEADLLSQLLYDSYIRRMKVLMHEQTSIHFLNVVMPTGIHLSIES
jgi:hypothetical protein